MWVVGFFEQEYRSSNISFIAPDQLLDVFVFEAGREVLTVKHVSARKGVP